MEVGFDESSALLK